MVPLDTSQFLGWPVEVVVQLALEAELVLLLVDVILVEVQELSLLVLPSGLVKEEVLARDFQSLFSCCL
eukprot:8342587-Prorocentrum_lima.AAC.1